MVIRSYINAVFGLFSGTGNTVSMGLIGKQECSNF